MAFAYFQKLSPSQKQTYQKSDKILFLEIPATPTFGALVAQLKQALKEGRVLSTHQAIDRIYHFLSHIFEVPRIHLMVLPERPRNARGELHGLYQLDSRKKTFKITLWMKTAKLSKVVSFKTFLRTALHEWLHHLDYTYFRFKYSFHTLGFYQRESSLLKQCLASLEASLSIAKEYNHGR